MPYRKHAEFLYEKTFSKEYCEHMIKSYIESSIAKYNKNVEVSLVVENGEIVCKVISKEEL